MTATKKIDRIDKEREELMKRLAELKIEEDKFQGVAGAAIVARVATRSGSRSSRDGGVHDGLQKKSSRDRTETPRRTQRPDDFRGQGLIRIRVEEHGVHASCTTAKAEDKDESSRNKCGGRCRR